MKNYTGPRIIEYIDDVAVVLCPKCKQKKSFSEYYQHRGKAFGIGSHCKKCVNTHPKLKTWLLTNYYRHRDKYLAYQRQYKKQLIKYKEI